MSTKKVRPFSTRLTGGDSLYNEFLSEQFRSAPVDLRNFLLGNLRARRYKALLDWADTVDPQKLGSPTNCFVVCQLAALVKKYPFNKDEVPGLNPELAALKKFKLAEHRCGRYNLRAILKRTRFNPHAQIYAYARDYIHRCLGASPNIDDILDKCGFTEGASLGIHGNKTNSARKIYADHWSVTPSACYYAKVAIWKNVHTREAVLGRHVPSGLVCHDKSRFVEIFNQKRLLASYNKITFVPKTAKTHRSIAVEPLLNGMLQSGVDATMCEKLRRVGINLSDRRVNQTLSRAGSLGGRNPYCTIDLSMASDSLATEVVRDLLPPDWFEFLCELRSPAYMLPDKTVHSYNKFCSMGNGFCFPLETLIFSSVCHAVERFVNGVATNDFSVFGDDIIVRQNVALLTIEILRDIGFKVNSDKTFITGAFRESCGADWYDGQDVRPVHVKQRMADVRHVFALHNATLRSPITETFFTEGRAVLRSSTMPYYRPGREPGDTCFSVPSDLFVGSRFANWDRESSRWRWREIISQPVVDRLEDLTMDERELALCYAVLRGAISEKPFAVRYITKPKVRTVSRPAMDGYHQVLPCADFRHVREIHGLIGIWTMKRKARPLLSGGVELGDLTGVRSC